VKGKPSRYVPDLVRRMARQKGASMRNFDSILVALDFSECSQELIEKSLEMSNESSRILLLHVAGASVGARASDSASKARWLESSHERLLGYRQQLLAEFHNVSVAVVEGPIAATIVETARKQQADLIIMGTHGRHGASRLIGGSIAAEVISLAACPVLTQRTQHKPTCTAKSCGQCDSHVTPELWQLMAEREG
jgi:nucleotide-binding universal stress UspA family protein